MKIHLVTPRNPSNFWTLEGILPTLGKGCLFPNLSMPTIAGLTPPEHEVTLCDENVEEIDFDVEADIVGVTGYMVHKSRMLEIIGEFRRRGRMVVVGGPYACLCPEELSGLCDVVFIDEAEETWPRFLRDLEAGAWKTEYRPLEKPDMTHAPMPRFDLLATDRYYALTVQAARGCPFTCEFCDIIVIYGRRPRAKSVEQVMAEIKECHRLGAEQVFIVDDNFIGDKKLTKELLQAIAAWSQEHGHPMFFNTQVSLNLAQDDELLELMRAAHFTSVFIGIESPRKESLAETKKTQNLRGELVESVHKIQSYGIQVQAGMIVGFDADDESIFEEQLRFTQEARIPYSVTGMLQALPKTPLYERVKREGRLLEDAPGDQFALSNIRPAGMTRTELYEGYRWLLDQIYDFENYRRRAQEYILTRGDRVISKRERGQDLGRLLRMIRDCVLLGGPRRAWFTLRLVVTTALRRPSALRDAMSFSLVHRGFHGYTRELLPQLEAAIGEFDREHATE